MQSVFIETENVSRFRAAVHTAADTEKGQPGMMLAHGRAGRGKTFAAQNYYAEYGGIYLRVWEGWTQTAFLQALCFEINGDRPRSANGCKVRVMETLDRDRQTIFVDEADRLSAKRIEDLRDIHDETGAAIVLIGEEELLGLVSNRRRIQSRVTQRVDFGPVSDADIVTFALEAADLSVGMDAAGRIRRQASGDFRVVRNMIQRLEEMARARETREITVKMVGQAKGA